MYWTVESRGRGWQLGLCIATSWLPKYWQGGNPGKAVAFCTLGLVGPPSVLCTLEPVQRTAGGGGVQIEVYTVVTVTGCLRLP